MLSIMFAVYLYGLATLAFLLGLIVVLFIALGILSTVMDVSFAVVGGKRPQISEDRDRADLSSGECDDVSGEDTKRQLESKRVSLEDERQELTHLRLPTSFDAGFGYDAYRHQGLARLRYVEARISSIDEVLSKDVA